MKPALRDRFDALLEDVLESLPPGVLALLDEIPLIVEDRPDPELLASMGLEPDASLCGLHTGIALTERSVEMSGAPSDEIRIFRRGVVETAGGWRGGEADERVREEIRITLLHEIGHHFGLDEADLAALGYE